jgi:hypothetical protein
MRIAAPIVLVVAALALLAGCGDSGNGITGSDTARFDGTKLIQEKWEHTSDCDRPPGASRWGCSIGSYRCQAVVVDRGWSVSCARPGESVAFIVRR